MFPTSPPDDSTKNPGTDCNKSPVLKEALFSISFALIVVIATLDSIFVLGLEEPVITTASSDNKSSCKTKF